MKCPRCNRIVESGKFCNACGERLEMEANTSWFVSSPPLTPSTARQEPTPITPESPANETKKEIDTEVLAGVVFIALLLIVAIFLFPSLHMYHSSYKFSQVLEETKEILNFCELLFDAGSRETGMFFLAILAVYYVPLFFSVLEIVGALIKSKSLCICSAGICVVILIFSAMQFYYEEGPGAIWGEDSMLAIGFWISLVGHVGVLGLSCKIKN